MYSQSHESSSCCNAVAKKAGVENELGVPLPIVPSQFPAEPVNAPIESDNTTKFHWASWAKNDAGNEVDEIDYMSNFYKRFNKVKSITSLIIHRFAAHPV